MNDQQNTFTTVTMDIAALMSVFSAMLGWMPHLAALLGIVWYGLQIWESPTFRDWRKRPRQ